LKEATVLMVGRFDTLARITRPYVVIDIRPHPWPGEGPRHKFENLTLPEMARDWVVVRLTEKVELDGVGIGHIDQSVV